MNTIRTTKNSNPVDFPSLESALQSWSRLKTKPDLWPLIQHVIAGVAIQLGEVKRVHIPESQSYIGVTFGSRPNVIGAYIGAHHVDHVVELPNSLEREVAPGYWRTVLSSSGKTDSKVDIELPKWKPRGDSDDRKASANATIVALLSAKEKILTTHLKELLSTALWQYTECDGKYTTRFISLGAVTKPTEKLNHEHVVPRKLLVEAMLNDPARCSEILESAIGCTVLVDEHKKIMQSEKSLKGLLGWDRYQAAGVVVYDLKTGEQVV